MQSPDDMQAPQDQKEQQRTNIDTVNRIRGALHTSLVDGMNSKSEAELLAEEEEEEETPKEDLGPSAFNVPDAASNLGFDNLPNVPAATASAIVADVTKSLQSKLIYVPPPTLQTAQAGGDLEKAAVDSWSEGMYKMLARGTPAFGLDPDGSAGSSLLQRLYELPCLLYEVLGSVSATVPERREIQG